ncbi:hypothetical protein HYS49_02565 [Candidatus Woesearchaeota archaeon]|nr:hypothetical protein [Candidatus Woesearchaeota archaeon]
MKKSLTRALLFAGGLGILSIPAYAGLRIAGLEGQLEHAGIHRAEQLARDKTNLGFAIEACHAGEGPIPPHCLALQERYAAVSQELAQLVSSPEYLSVSEQEEEIQANIESSNHWLYYGLLGSFGYGAFCLGLRAANHERKQQEDGAVKK